MEKTWNKKKKWFSLVELIIVITILSILSAIAFISFKNYSWNARDGNRVTTIKNIQNGLELLSVKTGNYLEPENMVEISWSWFFLKQWFFWKTLQQAIKMSGTVTDPLDATEYVYSTNEKNTKYQLWTYLEENNLSSYFPQTYADNSNYSKRYFYTLWHKIWILLEEDNSPILKNKYTTWIHLDENNTNFKAYFSNDLTSGNYTWSWEQLIQKITEIQSQNNLPENNSWEPQTPAEPIYDCDNVTDESAFTFNDGVITWYDQNVGGLDVVIPCTINGETVTSIGGFAFGLKWLTSVKIPNTIVDIWSDAFYVNQIVEIIIPNSVTSIWKSAFQQNQLINLIIPNSVTNIWDYAFYVNKLTNIVIWNNVTSIWNQAFQWNNIISVKIPNNVISIWNSAFARNNITSITLPNSVTNLWIQAFNLNWPSKNSWNITDWTSWNEWTWNISWTSWIKQN